MNYKELKDRLTKCEYTLKMFKNGTLVDKDKKTVRELKILKESLQKQMKEQEAGVVVTKDAGEAEKLAKKGINVNLKTEGPHQTTYIKVSKNDYKKAIQIIDQNIDREYVNTDIVDDDGDGNVIVYFNFTPATTDHDRYNPDSDPAEFIYDLSMDLQANGINITSASHDIDEAVDINDPILMKLRALQSRMAKKKAPKSRGISQEKAMDLRLKLQDLEDERADVLRNMEQEAEPEGGPIADDYGAILNDLDKKIDKIMSKLRQYDMNENLNRGDDVFALGYNLDATQYLVDYLKSKYKEGQDYELHIGRGDTHPNAVSLLNPDMEQDKELGNLLMSAGDNEETDYEINRRDDYMEGLWANINAKKKAGKKASHGNSKAHKNAVKAGNKLKEQDRAHKLSKNEISLIAHEAGKAVISAILKSGDEIRSAKIKDIYASALSGNSPEAFTVHVIYKNDKEDGYRFQIQDDKLYFLAPNNKDIAISDVGIKPSGEAVINTELIKNEMLKYFKNMNEQDIEQKFDDRGKPTHLGHKLSDKDKATLAKIADMIKNANNEDYDYNEGIEDVIDPADYGVIAQNYLDGFNKPHSLDLDQLEMLGRKIVKQLYKGDFKAAMARHGGTNVNEESELDKITKAMRLIKKQAPAMNKLDKDDPKRKAFIQNVVKLNKRAKELIDKEDGRVSNIGKGQELDEGRGDFDDVLKAIQNMSNNDDISERDAAEEIVLALADKFQLPVDKNLEDYMEESVNESTDLYDRNGILITRFAGGKERGLMVQITIGGKYIHIPANEYNNLVRAMASIRDDIRDMKLQQPADRYEGVNEADAKPIPDNILRGYNANVKNAQSMASALLSLFNQINDKEPTDFTSNGNIKRVLKLLNYVAKAPDTETDQGGEQTADGLDEASNSIRTPAYDEAREQFFDYLERTLDATYRNASKGATAKKLLNPHNEEFITQDILPAILKRDDQPFPAIFKQQMLGDENLRRDFVRVAIEMYPEPKITPDAVNPDGSEYMGEEGDIAHDCANHVLHEKYGHGICLEEQHTLVREGNKHVVTHYDVFFKEGSKTVRDIPVSELKVITESHHGHKRRKK